MLDSILTQLEQAQAVLDKICNYLSKPRTTVSLTEKVAVGELCVCSQHVIVLCNQNSHNIMQAVVLAQRDICRPWSVQHKII